MFAAGIPQSVTAQSPAEIRVDDSAVVVAENGGTYTQKVWLFSEPTANVTLQVTSGNTSVVTVSPTTLTFTPSNYHVKQEVTYTGVDDSARNFPPAHRATTVTYTASGGNYAGISHRVSVIASDDEPIVYALAEGFSYNVSMGFVVAQGCTPVVVHLVSSDTSLLRVEPTMLSWSEQDSGTAKAARMTFPLNNALGDSRVRLERRLTQPCEGAIDPQDLIFVVRDNDPWSLSVEGAPACGATVTDSSIPASTSLVLSPAPSAELETEYRWVTHTAQGEWRAAQPISTSGRSIAVTHSRLNELRRAYAGFAGFDYRLRDAPDVTARCTWSFDDDGSGDAPDGGGGGGGGGSPPANRPPAFGRSFYRFELPENEDGRRRPVALGTVEAEDPDGDAVTYSLASGDAERFAIGAADGAVLYVGPGEDYETEPNRFELTVRARDPHRAEALAQVVVEVVNVNDAPEAEDDEAETAEDVAVVVDVLANDTDPDGDALRVRSVSAAAHGSTAIGPRGVVYTPHANYHGTDRFTYVAADSDGEMAEAAVAVTVTPVNDAPEAEDDEAETAEDVAVVVDVLANDTDPDGDALRVRSVSAAAHGSTAIGPRGVVYTPHANYHGTDRFTYVAADSDGEMAEAAVAVTVTPVNDAPEAEGVIPDQTLDEGGGEKSVDLGPFFKDVDGDALSYRASSSDAAVTVVSVAGALMTLTPAEYGAAVVTVTAEDPQGLTAQQTFAVGVSDRLVRAVVGDTLAAMARSQLASARVTLGRRAPAKGAAGGSRLTVLGRPVPFDMASARAAAEQLLARWAAGAGGYGGRRGGPGLGPAAGTVAAGVGAGPGRMLPGAAAGAGGPGRAGNVGRSPLGGIPGVGGLGGWAAGMDPLRGSEFQLALGERTARAANPGRLWKLWGQGDIQTFAGAPSGSDYEGDIRTAYVGVDTALSARWWAGVAVSRGDGGGAWRVGDARGALSTSLTTAYPYVQWSEGPNSVWAAAGAGWGTAENVRESGRVGTSDLSLRLGLVEVRRDLDPVGGVDLNLRADAAWARLRTAAGDETVDRQSAAAHQVRTGAELSRPLRWEGGSLSPFGELHVRRDGGAGQTGTGLEVVAGTRLAVGRLRVDAQGRLLVLHSASGYRERGVGMTLGVGSRDRIGLSLLVSPRWGDAATGRGALWQEQVFRSRLPEARGDAWALDARGEYGTRLSSGGLLTWFGSLSRSAWGRRLMIGGRLGRPSSGP